MALVSCCCGYGFVVARAVSSCFVCWSFNSGLSMFARSVMLAFGHGLPYLFHCLKQVGSLWLAYAERVIIEPFLYRRARDAWFGRIGSLCRSVRHWQLVGCYFHGSVSCSRGDGAKNTLLAILTVCTCHLPVCSVAPGCCIVWQCIANRWQSLAKGRWSDSF